MDDNQALREILGEVRLLDAIIRESYDAVLPLSKTVTDSDPLVRPAGSDIIKTVITNAGISDAYISEEGILVYILPPKQTWTSPLSGSGEIKVTAAAAQPTSVAIATYTKG
jgi:hypothetical protein